MDKPQSQNRPLIFYADYSYDSINRLNLRTFHIDDKTLYSNYIYKTSERDDGTGTYRTNQLAVEIIDNTAYRYTYDNVGNITKIEKGTRTTADSSNTTTGSYTTVCSYVYDDLGQLVRENNVEDDKTYVWKYDILGNIESLLVYSYTTGAVANPVSGIDYQYTNDGKNGWKRLLTTLLYKTYAYVDGKGHIETCLEENITYDAIGNPIDYSYINYVYDEEIKDLKEISRSEGAEHQWYGRQLTNYSKGDVSATFTYDADGLRGSKTVNNAKTTYFYVGDKLYYQHTAKADGSTNYELYFYYDSYDNLSAIRYISSIGDYYYFVTTNKQGDVLGLYSENGNLKVSYEYDVWGNCTVKDASGNPITSSVHIGNVNPIRYRGYYYDNDLGLYYLQSRYYDATIGRFINADSEISDIGADILGNNSFAYCQNNPVNSSDPTGHWPKWLGGALTIAGGVAQIAAGAALGAFSSWTGIGAVAAGLLVINGGATVVQGIGQVVNAVTKSNIMREDNMVRTTVQAAGQAVGGDFGGEAAGFVYDAAVNVSSIYAASIPKTVCGCFVAGTAVLSALGSKAIEDIKAGEFVWSENPETGEKALKQVVRTFVNESDILIHIFVNGEEITATPEHPFYIPQKGWVGAIQLRAGDILVLQNGEYVIVEKVQHEILEAPIAVYNFEVEDFHTYYVGDSSVLVHNACTPKLNPGKFTKMRGNQGYKDKNGNFWKIDKLHKDHYDVSNSAGKKIKEVDFSGNIIWPNGAKNKNKR